MDISNTLRTCRENAHLTQAALSKISGVAQSAISDAENNQRELTISSLEKLCKSFSMSLIDFFSIAEGHTSSCSSDYHPSSYLMLNAHQRKLVDSLVAEILIKNSAVESHSSYLEYKLKSDGAHLPIHVHGEAAAGLPLYSETDADDVVELPSKYADPDHYRIIRARGDSMEPKIYTGDIVIAEIDVAPYEGQMALVYLAGLADDEYTIKRVYHDRGLIILRSYNSAYPDMKYSPEDIRSCEAIVDVLTVGGLK